MSGKTSCCKWQKLNSNWHQQRVLVGYWKVSGWFSGMIFIEPGAQMMLSGWQSFLPSWLWSHCWLHSHSPLGSSLGSHPPWRILAEKTVPFSNTSPMSPGFTVIGSSWVTVHSWWVRRWSYVPHLGPERSLTQSKIHRVESRGKVHQRNFRMSWPRGRANLWWVTKTVTVAYGCLR